MGVATVTLWRVLSLDNWADVMFKTGDATSKLSYIYFIATVLFSIFFGFNFGLVVIFDFYTQVRFVAVPALA